MPRCPFDHQVSFPGFFFPGATKKNRLYDYSIFPQFTKYNSSIAGEKKVSVTKEKGKQINDVFALSRPSSKIFSSRISIYLNLWHESKLQKNSIHFFSLLLRILSCGKSGYRKKWLPMSRWSLQFFIPDLLPPWKKPLMSGRSSVSISRNFSQNWNFKNLWKRVCRKFLSNYV